MKLKLLKNSNKSFFVKEEWNNKNTWDGIRTVKTSLILNRVGGGFSAVPYVKHEGEYIPLSEVLDNGAGALVRWLNRRDGVYSRLEGGSILVRFIVRYDEKSLEPIFEKSSVEVFSPNFDTATLEEVEFLEVFSPSTVLINSLNGLMRKLFSDEVSRKVLLERRMSESALINSKN